MIKVVYITHYTGNKLPPFYIGSSSERKVINGYNGSVKSKKYKKIYDYEQKENKHLFKTKILSYHKTTEDALEEELRLQKKHLVVKNNKYFNESYAQPNGFFGRDVSGKLNPMYGKTRYVSEETKRKISISNMGKTHNDEYKKMMSEKHSKSNNPFYNKKHSKESIIKMKKAQKGKNNGNAKIIEIFNNNDELQFTCKGNFSKICKDNGLPYRSLMKGKPLYQSASALTLAKRNNNEKFIGWYIIYK